MILKNVLCAWFEHIAVDRFPNFHSLIPATVTGQNTDLVHDNSTGGLCDINVAMIIIINYVSHAPVLFLTSLPVSPAFV